MDEETNYSVSLPVCNPNSFQSLHALAECFNLIYFIWLLSIKLHLRQVRRPHREHLTGTTLCANSDYFIWAEPNFKSHLDRQINKVMVSAL